MRGQREEYNFPSTKNALVNRRFRFDQKDGYECKTDRSFRRGSELLDYDTIQEQYWIRDEGRPQTVAGQRTTRTSVVPPQTPSKSKAGKFAQKRPSFQKIGKERVGLTPRSKQGTVKGKIPQPCQRRETLFKYDYAWQADTFSDQQSPKVLGSFLNRRDSAWRHPKFALNSEQYMHSHIRG